MMPHARPKLTLAANLEGIDLSSEVSAPKIVADVKCYYCGHISGQIIARRNQPLELENFVPRHGYTGPELKLGDRLRCERCRGPVFLEDVGPAATQRLDTEEALRRRLSAKRQEKAA